MTTARRLRIWFFVFLVLAVAAAFLPRLVAHGDATRAALTFLVLAFFATVIALVSLVQTLRHRANLSRRERLTGLLPIVLAVVGGLAFAALVQDNRRSAPQDPARTQPMAPTAVPRP